MNDIARYLVEEVVVDHADGLIPRREAVRRLSLLGLGVAAASTMLTACANEKSNGVVAPEGSTAPSKDASTAAADAASAGAIESITFPGPQGRTHQGAWAAPESVRGAVLVIHENRGLTEHHRGLTRRFAAAGYAAIALDLLSEEGGTASLGDPANATATLAKVPVDRFVADMRAALDELGRRAPQKKLGAIGFCFGGGMIWQLIASKDARLAAAAPFYGPLPDGADFTGSKAAVLAIYGELDARVNASRDAATAALVKAGLTHEIVTYPKADHAFFNDTGPRYNAEAAAAAWAKVLEWFGRHLG
jgi:carboxymethylenebutenolidase